MPSESENHKRNRDKYLITLFEYDEANSEENSAVIQELSEPQIAERSGLELRVVDRLSTELEREGLIQCMGGTGVAWYALTVDGHNHARQARDENSPQGRRRRFWRRVKKLGLDLGRKGMVPALTWLAKHWYLPAILSGLGLAWAWFAGLWKHFFR